MPMLMLALFFVLSLIVNGPWSMSYPRRQEENETRRRKYTEKANKQTKGPSIYLPMLSLSLFAHSILLTSFFFFSFHFATLPLRTRETV
ncbi:MAG: hypothetical protein BYD32DRAFT_417039 [Podila humilis]|nr:MAG: hypothetical protein BYD32DRAFT_417039 [Podila humilis]